LKAELYLQDSATPSALLNIYYSLYCIPVYLTINTV